MPLYVDIVTAERRVMSGEADEVIAPGIEGYLGILPGHAPLMTMLAPGELAIKRGDETEYLSVTGGYLEVLRNRVTVLADACERAEEIDIERARQAMERARERLVRRTSDIDLERAIAALRRAEVRLKVAQRRRRRGRQQQPPQ